jgi:hypothetical protein
MIVSDDQIFSGNTTESKKASKLTNSGDIPKVAEE